MQEGMGRAMRESYGLPINSKEEEGGRMRVKMQRVEEKIVVEKENWANVASLAG